MKLDLRLDENEELLRKTGLDFMQRDAPKEVVQRLQETDAGCTKDLWRKAADLGWLGILTPEKYGGAGASFMSAGVLFEALGTGPLPGPHFSSAILGSLILLEAGTEEQKQRFLPSAASGERILALALTEGHYGWDPAAVQTVATLERDGFVLRGLKLFVMDAASATDFIVAARSRERGAEDAVALFLVDAGAEGVSVRRLPGFLSGRSFEVRLDSVRVPRSAMIGVGAGAWDGLQSAILKAIPVLCAYKAGGCQALCDLALAYSRARVQFGQPIGRFQRVQDMILEMVNLADAARWTTYEALWKLDTQRPAAQSAHLAKAVSSASYWETCTLAHQVFSGISYSKEHPVSFHTKASRSLYSYLGEPAHHRRELARWLIEADGAQEGF